MVNRRLKIAKRSAIFIILIIAVAFVGGVIVYGQTLNPIDRSDPFYPSIDQSPPKGPICAYLALPISVCTWRTEYGWESPTWFRRSVNRSGWKAQGWLSRFNYESDVAVGLELGCAVDMFNDRTVKVQLRNCPNLDVYAYTSDTPAKSEIDYVSLYGVIAYGATPYDGEKYELPLVSAIKNGHEDVTNMLLNSDDQRVVLEPRDHLTLSFQVPTNFTYHEIRWKTGIFPWNYVIARQPEFGWYSLVVEGRHVE